MSIEAGYFLGMCLLTPVDQNKLKFTACVIHRKFTFPVTLLHPIAWPEYRNIQNILKAHRYPTIYHSFIFLYNCLVCGIAHIKGVWIKKCLCDYYSCGETCDAPADHLSFRLLLLPLTLSQHFRRSSWAQHMPWHPVPLSLSVSSCSASPRSPPLVLWSSLGRSVLLFSQTEWHDLLTCVFIPFSLFFLPLCISPSQT